MIRKALPAFFASYFLFLASSDVPIVFGPHLSAASHPNWVLRAQYSDEFNQTRLDLEKWDSNVRDWGLWSWEPENAWVDGGYLHLRMQFQPHERGSRRLFYTSGIIRSKAPPIKYGYFEARIRAAPRYPGVCPAFWAFRETEQQWTEIDFTELTQRRKNVRIIDSNTHVFRHPKLPRGQRIREGRPWKAPWDPRDGFHKYGTEWNESEIRWYVDGELVATRRNEYWHQPLDIVISFGLRGPLNRAPSPAGFPTEFLVDYVRVWQRKSGTD